jgi:hypothetical protein
MCCVRARENTGRRFPPVSQQQQQQQQQQHQQQQHQQQQLFVANAEWRTCKEEEKSLELREGSAATQTAPHHNRNLKKPAREWALSNSSSSNHSQHHHHRHHHWFNNINANNNNNKKN